MQPTRSGIDCGQLCVSVNHLKAVAIHTDKARDKIAASFEVIIASLPGAAFLPTIPPARGGSSIDGAGLKRWLVI